MIDTHIHSDTRGLEDLELMAMCLDGVITLAHDPFEMKNVKVWEAHVEKLLNGEIERAKKVGLNLFVCVGMHPRAIPPEVDEALNKIRDYINHDKVVGIGEIGLEKATKEEREVFIKQLLLAEESKLPAVVHTPRRNKEEITKIILDEISTLNLKNSNIVIEHCNKETVKWALDAGFYAGLTVQPGKLTPLEAVEIIKENKDFANKILLNSDCSSNPSDVLAVPGTVLKMKIEGIGKEIIDKVSQKNALELFNLKV
ncbi:TatD family hydrolase [Methanocaldococcus fervens]|uniref:TatD family hydrolase n=1 Tax=Methanocaldococcus fervens TaxID=83171 RepID=UPI000A6B9511|nr:TatD family hydrolase [Methanocaldococcus fervens]